MATSPLSRRTEQLQDEIRSLATRGRDVLDDGLSHTKKIAGRVGGRLEDRLEKFADTWSSTKDGVLTGARRTDETIRAHPYQSIAIALGIGVLLGAVACGGSRRAD